ncbi:NAD-dependent epimerase/dehydratase family protein [Celeribacter halophilus]|uniref:NAD-dependent epimerase/dehydratase family protein n=1 Tax=Celeribacter halophilus TaxID=576117 RepID=UPI001C092F96|nr:NAD(P)-dependent oxidoreductase [Celeribacter halophilus]MBU2888857.1 NAD(P)-dependent oxidoreductase [Celeribacter halophilus]MDO6511975.1 NAD(P)-dependent oxidoreductase [Celeribacter halophilus]
MVKVDLLVKYPPKITIIGGAGFVGTNFCQILYDRNIPFEIIDLKRSWRFPEKSKIADVRNINSMRNAITGDVVVNLAAVHRDDIRDKLEYHRTNVGGAENVAKVCSEKGIKKIVFTSSVAVYGFAEPGTGENGAIRPFNDYGKTKFEAEEKFREWQISSDNNLIIVRPTVIFGEGNRGNVYNLFKQIASGRFIMIGPGTNRKSMAYIGNVAAFLEKCIESDQKYAVYNYVDTPDLDMNTLVRQVRNILKDRDNVGWRLPLWVGLMLGRAADGFTLMTGKNLPISAIRVKKFCASTVFSSAKEQIESFSPPFSLQEGIVRTLRSEFLSPSSEREIFYTE